jgi:hypothetical protein
MKETTMSRRYERAAMDRPCPGEVVEEEIDCVNMNQIRSLDVPEHGRGDRVTRRAEIPNSHNLDSVKSFHRRQALSIRSVEQAV